MSCSLYISHPKAPLFVAFRTNSGAIRLSRRLANPAPRRSRCSRGFVHGTAVDGTVGSGLAAGVRPGSHPVLRLFQIRWLRPDLQGRAAPRTRPPRHSRANASRPAVLMYSHWTTLQSCSVTFRAPKAPLALLLANSSAMRLSSRLASGLERTARGPAWVSSRGRRRC